MYAIIIIATIDTYFCYMHIESAKYISSYVDVKKCPQDHLPEFAFIGRSNVGKSSLINMITGFNSLAKISVAPGKTKTINFFLINEKWHLVDLPGYGYAKVSKEMRAKWEIMIKNYLWEREDLISVFQLIDGSIPPQQIDIDFTNWLGENEISFALVFTKTDKKKKDVSDPIKYYEKELLKTWDTLPRKFITSARTKSGKKELLEFIQALISN